MQDTALNRFRSEPDLPRLAATLALVVLAQVLLPTQAHSRMAQTIDGRAFEVCTWGGGTADLGDDEQPKRASAALWFSQLAGDLTAGSLSTLPVSIALAGIPWDSLLVLLHLPTLTVANTIRAPPSA